MIMTAEEYIKHYASGQGGFESVSVDVALRAIEYAKQEMKQQLMKDAVEGEIVKDIANNLYIGKAKVNKNNFKFGDKVKLLVLKEE